MKLVIWTHKHGIDAWTADDDITIQQVASTLVAEGSWDFDEDDAEDIEIRDHYHFKVHN